MPTPTLRETVSYTRLTSAESINRTREAIQERTLANARDEQQIAELQKLVNQCDEFLGL
jgi:hypothetical protein